MWASSSLLTMSGGLDIYNFDGAHDGGSFTLPFSVADFIAEMIVRDRGPFHIDFIHTHTSLCRTVIGCLLVDAYDISSLHPLSLFKASSLNTSRLGLTKSRIQKDVALFRLKPLPYSRLRPLHDQRLVVFHLQLFFGNELHPPQYIPKQTEISQCC